MRVFLSWSGKLSRAVAAALREWLPNVLQAAEPWMSAEDIKSGARWSFDIAGQLSETKVGIICITPENLEAPWVHFEAGALSKTIEKSLVCPYLISLRPSDLRGPLAQFQATVADKVGTYKLIWTINSASGTDSLSDKQLEKAFDHWWPEFEGKLQAIFSAKELPRPRRSEHDLLEEILSLVRGHARREPFGSSTELNGRSGGLPMRFYDLAANPVLMPNALLGEAQAGELAQESGVARSADSPEAERAKESQGHGRDKNT